MSFPTISTRTRVLLTFGAVLLAITFFMGDIGVYSDDYFCNQRDPAAGEINGLVMNRPWHPWRPLTRLGLPPVITVLWNHPWMLHAISAALHASVIALAYGIMRRFGVRAGIAAPVCLALLVYPVFFEVLLWNAVICTLLSVVLMLLVWHLYLWWLTAEAERPGWLRFCALVAIGALSFASAALNEQAVGALAALPLAPAVLGLARARARARRVVRTAAPIVAVSVAAAIYLAGFLHHLHQIGGQISRDKTQGVAGFLHRACEVAREAPREMLLREFGSGAWSEGIRAIVEHPLRAALAGALLGVLGLAWVRSRASDSDVNTRGRSVPTARWAVLALLGSAWMIGAWIPVILSYMVIWPRLHDVPAIGLAIAMAALCSYLAPLADRLSLGAQSTLHFALRSALAIAIGLSLVVWIGLQANFQRRWKADKSETESLAHIFTRSIEPGTYFIPIRIESRTAATGSQRFDSYFRHGWYWQFSAGWRLQSALQSPFAYTVQADTGVGLWATDDDPEHAGILRATPVRPKPSVGLLAAGTSDPGDFRLPWDRTVFFEIDRAGNVRIFTRLRIHPHGREPFEIIPRQIAISKGAAALPTHMLDVYPMVPEHRRPQSVSSDPLRVISPTAH